VDDGGGTISKWWGNNGRLKHSGGGVRKGSGVC